VRRKPKCEVSISPLGYWLPHNLISIRGLNSRNGIDVRSFRFDARKLDHLGPLFGGISDEFAEFGGRHRLRLNTKGTTQENGIKSIPLLTLSWASLRSLVSAFGGLANIAILGRHVRC
jgi:hypothetical protein